MTPFSYTAPETLPEALDDLAAHAGARPLGGGTNLVDLMRRCVESPERLVDLKALGLDEIDASTDGLRIGASVSNTALASDARVRRDYRVLSEALLAGATQQLRNRATTAGNVLQRTRCTYFTDPGFPCNKREPGSGCPARDGYNRLHAILGASASCIATHPSDLCVALAALDATVEIVSPHGTRTIPLVDFHLLPGDTPDVETALEAGEIITAVSLPAPSALSRQSVYVKVRDRQSYAFALVSVAACLALDGDRVADVRLALGGVAHKPWRATEAEEMLRGSPATPEAFEAAGRAIVAHAVGHGGNGFKILLAPKVVTVALNKALSLARTSA